VLIVAVPKSASSALVATLRSQHALSYDSERIRRAELSRCPVAEDYRQLEWFHRREVAEIDAAVVASLSRPRSLAKLHLPPTANNQLRLEQVRKVILLRDAREVIRAYRRGNEAGVFNLHHPAFCFCLSEDDWMRRAHETGVIEQLERFEAGWRAHRGDCLVMESDALIREPAAALARIEAYFELPRSGVKELARVRYTRSPAERPSVARILYGRRKIILERVARDVGGLFVPSLRTRGAARSGRAHA
jgi:hypothetical protein